MIAGNETLGRRLSRLVVRRRGVTIGIWVVVAAALLPFAGGAERVLEVAARVRGSEAAAVDRELRERFKSPFANNAVLVVTGVPAPSDPRMAPLLDEIVRAVRGVPGVTGSFSYRDLPDSVFLPAGTVSGTLIVFGLDASLGPVDALVPPLRAVTERLAPAIRRSFPDAQLRWTGEVAINFDLRRTSADEVSVAEQRILPLTLIALVIAFGTIAAALLPVMAGGLAISLTLGAAVLIARQWPLSILLQNTASMIGFGVGIDYALLTISRFRESLASGAEVREAAEEAAYHAGGTIAISGVVVMIGFAALLLVPLNELQSIAVGGLLVVGISVLMAMTLFPALLAYIGRRIELGRLWRLRTGASERWRRWGRWVATHPWPALVAAGIPLLILAWQGRRMNADIPRGNWLPSSMESAKGLDDLDRMGRTGVVNTIRVLLELPDGVRVLDSAGWTAAKRLTATLASDRMTARVRSVTAVVPGNLPNMTLYSMIPSPIRRTLVSEDERAVLLEVVPVAADFTDLTSFARRLRRIDAQEATGLRDARIRIGGLPGFNADYEDAIHRVFRIVILLVVGTTLVTLMIVFRSVLVPVKAVLLNLLSVGAAFGAVVLVFQDGIGSHWLGVGSPMAGVFPAVPIVVFCIVFGLSMDYEIFLVSRVAEARRSGLSESESLAEALARTGGVITSAATIMILVFAAFTLGEFLLTKILGFALAVAVFLDATLVRMVVGPALLRLAGRWNWWPGSLSRESTAGR
jgi:RND superfamily putative drug exporter